MNCATAGLVASFFGGSKDAFLESNPGELQGRAVQGFYHGILDWQMKAPVFVATKAIFDWYHGITNSGSWYH